MLKKLIKVEWKYFWKIFLLLLAAIGAATALGMFAGRSFGELATSSGGPEQIGDVLLWMLGIMVFYILVIAASVGFIVITGVRFFKTVFGDAGYITNTLPVTGRQILWANLIFYGICNFVLAVAMLLSMGGVSNSMFSGMMATDLPFDYSDFYLQSLGIGAGAGSTVLSILQLAVSGPAGMILLYLSIVIGQHFKKHKVFGAVLSYLGISFVMGVAIMVVTIPYVVTSVLTSTAPDINAFMMPIRTISFMVSLVFSVIAYFIVDRSLNRKLNLE